MDIFELLTTELFRNAVSCGPGLTDTALFPYTRDLSSIGFGEAKHVIPSEGFHPKIAVAIDFTHTFVRTTSDVEPTRLVTKELLSSESNRLAKFVKYYFENLYAYGADRNDIKLDSPFTGELEKNLADENVDDEYAQNKFLNELLNYMITDISVNRGRSEIGSATITFKDNRNLVKGKANAQRALVNNALPVLHQLLVPMLPIRIWSKGRLYKDYYFPLFDGYITAISYNDASGFAQIQVTAKDVLEIARFSAEMISPSLIQQEELRNSLSLQFLSKPFYGHDHSEIVKKLLVGGKLIFDPTGLQYQLKQHALTKEELKKGLSISELGIGHVLDAVAVRAETIIKYNDQAQLSYNKMAASFGPNNVTAENASELDKYATDDNSINLLALDNFRFVSSMVRGGKSKIARILEGRAIYYRGFTMDTMLSEVSHKTNKRNVIFWGTEITPYRIWGIESPSTFDSHFSNRLDILREVSENTYYELYVDGAGNVHYHPQRLTNKFMEADFVVGDDSSTLYEHKHIWNGANVLGPEEVTSTVPVLNFDELITFLKISGIDPVGAVDAELGSIVGSAVHNKYLARFGYRRQILKTPLFNINVSLSSESGKTKKASNLFGDLAAACFLVNKNSDVYTKQATLIHRPELMDLCFPAYFTEDNTVFYINTINHSASIGGDALTTVNANFGRRPDEAPADLQSFILITERVYKTNGDVAFDEVVRNLPVGDWLDFLQDQSKKELETLKQKIWAEDVLGTLLDSADQEDTVGGLNI